MAYVCFDFSPNERGDKAKSCVMSEGATANAQLRYRYIILSLLLWHLFHGQAVVDGHICPYPLVSAFSSAFSLVLSALRGIDVGGRRLLTSAQLISLAEVCIAWC